MRLAMLRRGEFEINWTPNNENQCGLRRTTPEQSKLWYEVTVVGDDRHLDEQGFIVDQFVIHKMFLDTFTNIPVFPSCEGVSSMACRKLWELLGPTCPTGQRVWNVVVVVGAVDPTDGSHWAGITAEMPDDPDPARKAKRRVRRERLVQQ